MRSAWAFALLTACGSQKPAPVPTPTPTPIPEGIQLANTLNDGVAGQSVVSGSPDDGGSSFDQVVDNGGSVVLDATHTRGPGLAAKHEVGYHGNAYYGWGSSFSWAPVWYGRVYVWFDSLLNYYTALGYGEPTPPPGMRLIGPITSLNGLLLIGWSVAIIFEVMRMAEVQVARLEKKDES